MSRKSKQPQIQMGLKFSGNSVIKVLQYRITRLSAILDQYLFWRTPLLWFNIFLNVAASTYTLTWLYSNLDKLPREVSLWYYFLEESNRFYSSSNIPELLIVNAVFQAISLLLAHKVSQRFRPLSMFLLICICIASITFYLALYKSISLVVK